VASPANSLSTLDNSSLVNSPVASQDNSPEAFQDNSPVASQDNSPVASQDNNPEASPDSSLAPSLHNLWLLFSLFPPNLLPARSSLLLPRLLLRPLTRP